MVTVLAFSIDNAIDLITNSSSELFVFKGRTKEIVCNLLDAIYPGWEREYQEPENIEELSVEELDNFFSYACSAHTWPTESKNEYPVLPGFTFDELYEEEEGKQRIAWNNQIQYRLKSNKGKYWGYFITEDNKDWAINKLSPNRDMWFLFSKNDNPDFRMQNEIEKFADRYHLG